MRVIYKVILLTSLFATPVWAHTPSANQDNKGEQRTNMMSRGSMIEMNKHMGKLQSQMANIKKEKSSEKRNMMMHKHMQSMQQGMRMMGGGMESSDKKGMENMPIDKRMEMMQNQINMMKMMMGQMMEYNAVKDAQ